MQTLGSVADQALSDNGLAWWRQADMAALRQAVDAVPAAELEEWPRVARWRALLGWLQERDDTLACLERAHAGHLKQGQGADAALDAHIALALILADIGGMDQVQTWQERAAPAPAFEAASPWALWQALGALAQAVLGGAAPPPKPLLEWLRQRLEPLRDDSPAHERLWVAALLVQDQFSRQQFEQIERLAHAVGTPPVLGAAGDVPAARWLYLLGYCRYQIGRLDGARQAWAEGLQRAASAPHTRAMLGLAQLRLLIDGGRLAEAQQLQASIAPAFGASRTGQLVELLQMRARLALMQGHSAQALAQLEEALALAHEARWSGSELAACHTDLGQVWLAQGHAEKAQAWFERCAAEASGRNASVFQCLGWMVQAERLREAEPAAARAALSAALLLAARLRYTMFLRLLPARAAALCAWALQEGIEPDFVRELARARALPAPAGASAGASWPWPVWLRLLGGFEMHLHGDRWHAEGRPQAKPLELLRLLACTPEQQAPARLVCDALWPDADGAAAQKNLEMALQRLRRLLGNERWVRLHDGQLSLPITAVCSDWRARRALTQRFADLALAPEPAAWAPLLAQVHEELARWQALAGATAELLPDASDVAWLVAQREEGRRDVKRAAAALHNLIDRATRSARRDAPAEAACATLREAVRSVFG